jgi:hypothetical protein
MWSASALGCDPRPASRASGRIPMSATIGRAALEHRDPVAGGDGGCPRATTVVLSVGAARRRFCQDVVRPCPECPPRRPAPFSPDLPVAERTNRGRRAAMEYHCPSGSRVATGLQRRRFATTNRWACCPPPTQRRGIASTREATHQTLFIRRARALGLPLSSLKALAADLNGRPSRSAPTAGAAGDEHLRAVCDQIADCHVLEQQLEQALQCRGHQPSAGASEACQCLDGSATAMSEQPPTRERGGADMGAHSNMETMTRLAAASTGDCDCSCGCESRSALPVKHQRPPLLPLRRAASAGGEVRRRPRVDVAADPSVRQR